MYFTFWSIVVTTGYAASFNITELCVSTTEYGYGFCMILRIKSWSVGPEVEKTIGPSWVGFLPEDVFLNKSNAIYNVQEVSDCMNLFESFQYQI
jgi:hypothetical protein